MTSELRQIERLPNERELHFWADYAELNCLVNADRLYSRGQLQMQIRRGRDNGEALDETTQGDPILDDRTVDQMLGLAEPESQYGDSLITMSAAEASSRSSGDQQESADSQQTDDLAVQVDDIWRYLQYRANAFADSWPFLLEPTTQALTLRPNLTNGQRVYIFLLKCATLRYQHLTVAQSLTSKFELVAHQAFVAAFPDWEVHVFGTAALPGSRFNRSQLWDRLVLLAQELRCRLEVERDDLSEHNVGDGGLDLVAWLPLPEKSKGLPMAFGQCACGATNWKDKQGEANEQRWGEIIKLSAPVQNWTFIPFCYHNPQGDWEIPFEVQKGILVDRLRMFALIASRLDRVDAILTEAGL